MTVRQGRFDDMLVLDEDLLILARGRIWRLTGIAAAVVDFVSVPRSEHEIRHRIEAEFGAGPDGAFQGVIDELRRHGLVDLH